MAVIAAFAAAPGAAHAQNLTGHSRLTLNSDDAGATWYPGTTNSIDVLSYAQSIERVGYLVFTIPGGASYTAVNLSYNFNNNNGQSGIAVTVKAADAVDTGASDSGTQMRAAATYATISVSSAGSSGVVALNSTAIARMNQIAQAGGGDFAIGFIVGRDSGHYVDLQGMSQLQPLAPAPTVTAVSPNLGAPAGGTSVVITGTNFTGASTVRFGGANATSFVVNSATQITAVSPARTPGNVSITVTTPSGTSTSTINDRFTYAAAPTVTALSPSQSSTGGGTTVTLTGTNLTGATQVTFGGVAATNVTVLSATQVRATSPAVGSAGPVNVRVTTPGGTSATGGGNVYNYVVVPAPTVTAVGPNSGVAAGGTFVTLTGTNFIDVTGVTFGATPSTSVTVNSNLEIVARVPAGALGPVNVRVTTPNGTSAATSANQYIYVTTPTITAISPASGPRSGGTPVTITGTGFLGAFDLTFGGTSTGAYTIDSDTQISAFAPADGQNSVVNVRVRNRAGTSAATAADQYTYIPGPTVTGLSPSRGSTAGGTSVVLTGTGFTGATAVRFGATAATGFTVTSDTQITAVAPAGSGDVNVRVTAPGGDSANEPGNVFRYAFPPTVTAISPSSGPTAGGTSVIITGTDFDGSASVSFGGVSATGVSYNGPNQITATSPAGSGVVDVRVTKSGVTSDVVPAGRFTYQTAPVIASVSPAEGIAHASTRPANVTITGSSFSASGNRVDFGTTPGTIVSESPTSIVVTPPANAAGGLVNVVVVNAGGQAGAVLNGYRYILPPTVTVNWSPDVINVGSGRTIFSVTVTNPNGVALQNVGVASNGANTPFSLTAFNTTCGTSGNFNANSGFRFSGQTLAAGASCTANPEQEAFSGGVFQFVTTPPTSSGTATTPLALSGVAATSNTITVFGNPTISSISPNAGPQAGGQAVTLTGTNFTGATAVTIDGQPATDVTVVSATSITATTPAATNGAGNRNVAVTGPGGTGTRVNLYAYNPVPTTPTVALPVDLSTTGLRPTYRGSATNGNTVTVYVDGAVVGTTVSSGGEWTLQQPTELAAGAHTVYVTAFLASRGTSAPSTTVNFTVDGTAPAAPVVTTPTNGTSTRDNTPTFTGTAEVGATVRISANSVVLATVTAGGSGAWTVTLPVQADAQYSYQVTAADAAGNVSPATVRAVRIDTAAPAAPTLTAPADNAPATSEMPTFSGTGEPNSLINLRFNGDNFVSGIFSDGTGAWSYSFPAGQATASGVYVATVTNEDFAGNVSPVSNGRTFTIDRTAPVVQSSAPEFQGSAQVTDKVFLVTFNEAIGTATAADFTLTTTGSAMGTIGSVATSGAQVRVTVTRLSGEGTVRVDVRAGNGVTDALGNGGGVNNTTTAAFSTGTTHRVDTVAPAAPVLTAPLDGAIVTTATPTVTGTTEAGATVIIYIDDNFAGQATAGGTGAFSIQLTTQDEGFHRLQFLIFDTAGNSSGILPATSFIVDTTAPATPVILTPIEGSTSAGRSVVLSGTAEANATVLIVLDGANQTVTASNAGAWSYTATNLADGAHAFTVQARDAANFSSPVSAPRTFTVDSTAPLAPTITSPVAGSTTNNSTPILSGTAEANAAVVVTIDGATAGTVTADGSGAWSLTPTALADGPHTVSAVSTDAAGNASPASAAITFTVDGSPPTAPVISAPVNGAVTADATLTITGTAEAGATVAVTIDGTAAGTVTADGSGAWSLTSTALADGPHTVTATAMDAVGNASPVSATVSFTVDVSAPVAPEITTPTAGSLTGDATPTISGTAEAGATVAVTIDGATAGTVTADGSGVWSLTSGALADGPHTVSAISTDGVGNASPASAAVTFTVDASAPTAPVISAPVNGAVTADNTPAISGTAEANSTVTVSIDGAAAGTVTADSSGAWSLTSAALADGPHTVSATATDAAGNVSPASVTTTFTIDASAPAAPVITAPVNGVVTADATPTITGTAEAAATVTVTIDGATAGAVTADGSGAWSLTSGALADGTHSVSATATDAVGNVSSASGTITFTVDASAPAAPVITAPVDGSATDDGTPTISGTAEAGATVQLSINGGAAIAVTATGGVWSYTPTTNLPAGQNTLSATAVDAAGNASSASTTVRFTYSPVTITTTSLPAGQVGVAYAATIQVSGGSAPFGFAVTSGVLPDGVRLSGGGALSGTPMASGDFTFTVTATDAGGLSTSQALAVTIARPDEPEVTDVDDVEVTANPSGSGEPTTIDLSGSVRNATRIEIVTPPANGTATVNGFEVVYVPNAGYFGRDSFTYRAVGFDDGGAASAAPSQGGPSSAVSEPATVSIIIVAPTLTLAGGAQPSGQIGVAYSQTLTASGGTAPYSYAVTGGALPAGIALAADGVLSGSPTAGGTFTFTVTATDSSSGTGPFSVSAVHQLTVAAPALTVTPAALPNATTAQAYSQAFSTSGGVAPYAYAVTAGALPIGLTLSTAGVLSGTPTQGGAFTFTVTATDSSTGAGPYSASQSVTLSVAASTIAVTPTTLAGGTRGTPYSASLAAAGGVAPYSYAVASGALPAGLTLSVTGQISGTPTVVGTFAFQVRATDSATGAGPYSGVADVTLTIGSATLTVTPTTLPGVLAGVAYSQQLAASGGQGGYRFAVTGGVLPAGLTLSQAGLLSGKPTTAGTFAFTVTATDGFGNTGAAALSVVVTGRPDPSADPDVRGLNSAQADAARRMVGTQIGTFGRRLEQLHGGAQAQGSLSLNLTLDGSAFTPLDESRQSMGELGQVLGRSGQGGRDRSGRDELGRMVSNGRDVDPATASADRGLNAAPQDGSGGPGDGPRVWAGGAISLGERDAETQTAEMSITTSGVSVGVDMSVADGLDLGVGVGFGQENVDVGIEDSRLEADSWVGVAYGSWRPQGDLFVDGMLGYGRLGFDSRRRTPVDQSLVFGRRDGTALFGSLSAGLDRTAGSARWIGYGRVDMLDADLDAYVETGSPLWALSYDARSVQSRQGTLGLRYERVVIRGEDRWTPGVRAEWSHEFGDADAQTLRYADWLEGPGFSIGQDGWNRSRLNLGLSLGWTSTSGWSWATEYEGGFSDGSRLNGLRLKIGKLF